MDVAPFLKEYKGPRPRQNAKVAYSPDEELTIRIDHPEKQPARIGLTGKRFKSLKKRIQTKREKRLRESIKYDKQMERKRTAMYEKADADHRKLFPPSARTPAKIIDALRADAHKMIIEEQSATAVAASSSSSSTGAASAAMSSEPFLTQDDQELRDPIDYQVCLAEGGRCNPAVAAMTGRWEEAP